jgi:UDP-N-acetylmuramate dehydrogenase
MTTFAEITTLGVGGEIAKLIRATSERELITAVSDADAAGIPLVVVGGGSNILANDAEYEGVVVKVETTGNSYEIDACSGGMLSVAAGEDWDTFVQFTLSKNLANLESLSGIPGTVGASPIQNIGAYGHEVGEVIARVRTYDRKSKEIKTFSAIECGFSYRSSRFKEESERYVILEVVFQLRRGENSLAIEYQQLADELGVLIGERVSCNRVREAVLKLRSSKGMLLNDGYKSAGSFFTNPIVSKELADTLPEFAPRFAVNSSPQIPEKTSGELIKLSAAWLIEHSGFARGFGWGNAGISPLHTLALINRGGAQSWEIKELANHIVMRVEKNFGVVLTPEVRFL